MRNNKAFIVVLLFVAWSLFSWHWYTCWVKGFCGAQQNVAIESIKKDTTNIEPSIGSIGNVEKKKKEECLMYLTGYIRQGHGNEMSNVKRLEEFLNRYEGETLLVNGIYEDDDEFAVNRFQEKYRSAVLEPWDIAEPTGYVYKTTREHINKLYCGYIAE